ncbi:heavy-metal-associated domain-containing protein [Candidatus Parcubacteria bacterium]|nr:heavy-metal-associated domain-containing protein [Candidatus Parcubacteria bacterium]
MDKTTLKLEGMHCGACATAIQMYLSTSDGVSGATVDYDKKEAEVEFDPSKITVDALIEKVKEIGYGAHQ